MGFGVGVGGRGLGFGVRVKGAGVRGITFHVLVVTFKDDDSLEKGAGLVIRDRFSLIIIVSVEGNAGSRDTCLLVWCCGFTLCFFCYAFPAVSGHVSVDAAVAAFTFKGRSRRVVGSLCGCLVGRRLLVGVVIAAAVAFVIALSFTFASAASSALAGRVSSSFARVVS